MRRPFQYILRLSDRAVEVLDADGQTRARVPQEKSAGDDARFAQWRASVAALAGSHGLAGSRVAVAYASTTGASSVVSLPASLGPEERRAGATLALGESLTLDLDASPSDAIEVASGRDVRLMLACADQPAGVQEVYRLVSDAGLVVDRLVPESAFEVSQAMEAVNGKPGAGAVTALWIGMTTSVLAASVDGVVTMVRSVPVGLWTLVDALERPFTARSSGRNVTLSRAEAERVLAEIGVPGGQSDQQVEEGLMARDLAPSLVPIVRRLAVEVKQTVRFGIAANRRGEATCVLHGPGAAVPGLLVSLGETTEVPVTPAPSATRRVIRRLPSLLPAQERERREARGARTLLWAGLAAAALAVGIEGLLTERAAASIERTVLALGAEVEVAPEASGAPPALRRSVDDTLSRVHAALPARAPWHGLLAELAAASPEEVVLSKIELSHETGHATCTIQGVCRSGAHGVSGVLGGFSRALESLPAVESVRLGEVTSESEGAEFSMELRLRLMPMTLAGETVDEGGTP
ncbi:MAG: hypothetical protein DYG92_04750 [Leptolyngbya sp. PLA1]|nr:hypothetical protein [Leptolyngbya sp. PLA1]